MVLGVQHVQEPLTLQLQPIGEPVPVMGSKTSPILCAFDVLPYSESDPSERGCKATDAPSDSGKPLGNAGVAAAFLPVTETKGREGLIIQPVLTRHRCNETHLSFSLKAVSARHRPLLR